MAKHKKHKWTEADKLQLRKLYPDMRATDVASAMGLREKQVYMMAMVLGIKKSDAFRESEKSGRIMRGHTNPRMVASRFKKGLTPWNKGTKGVVVVQEACRATQFKPGIMPHNTQPVGSYRVNKDGYMQQKVSNAKGPSRARWRSVAELVWCAANGPMPAGHIVVFKPGQATAVLEQITIDRVECITRAENMRRNSIHTRHPELARLSQLKGAITRQVNRITREHQEKHP